VARQLLSTKYLYALELVAQLFVDHKRAVGNIPYVTHLFGVCYIVQQLTDDREVHLGALLHDVLEDIPAEEYSAKQLQADFGAGVLRLVQAVSFDEVRYGKDESRRQYIAQLKVAPIDACLVSGADMLHNGRDFMYWYNREPAETTKQFGPEKIRRRDWFWHERLVVIEHRLGADHDLVKELRAMFRDLEVINQKIM
jgi:GTP pyrophosphokinase